jgi:DNA-binding HxlR family transcriptional regulator
VNRSYGEQCGVARSLDVVGERWALLVVRELLLGPKRFNDLLAGLAGASPNVISQRLRELTASGVVRQRDLGPPARVRVYELTDWGRELEPVIVHLGQWGTRAPLPDNARAGLDSILIALQAVADPAVVTGRYELRIGAEVFTADGTSGTVRLRRGSADEPGAILTADAGAFHAVAVGSRALADAAAAGELRLDGDPQAITGLTGLVQALISSAQPGERSEAQPDPKPATRSRA